MVMRALMVMSGTARTVKEVIGKLTVTEMETLIFQETGGLSGDNKGGVGGLDCGDGVCSLVGKTRRPRESVSISSILSENISGFMAQSSS